MIVWGGTYNNTTLADGGRYNPSTRSWSPISQSGAPTVVNHVAFWTGTEMIIFGSQQEVHFYNPITDSWRVGETSGAPEYNTGRSVVWTGTELIVFGGVDSRPGRSNYNTGSRYNPVTGSWTALSSTNAPGFAYHTAVWTGREMIVFGGFSFTSNLAQSGFRYNPATDTWTALSTTNAPQGRYRHTAVWTGSEMIVWGGETGNSNYATNYGRYNPSANEGNGAWVTLDSNSGPAARADHKAIWTGSEMIVYGGFNVDNLLLSNGRYNPTMGLWTGVSTTGAPKARGGYTTIWTGSEMILYGGFSGSSYFREVSSYKPGRQMYLYQRP
jgi:N-acetylneuraminic acid mutarotase